jgi:hypothetical protein
MDVPFDPHGDWVARQFFSPADLELAPEEYAAQHGHEWACFALHRHDYQDPSLGKWIRRLGAILEDADELESCQQRFLKPEELARVRKEEAEGF